jgi:hypothetical protein
MSAAVKETGWLPEPVVEFDDDAGGAPKTAYISLRPGRYTRVVQPHEDHLVFLYVAADGMPIGIRMLQPATNWVGNEIVQRLLSSPNGASTALDGPERFHVPPMTLDQIDAVIHRIREVNERLEPKTAPAK